MCGIAGFIDKNSCLDKSNLLSMLSSIAHRGPDDEGTYLYKNVALGHRRLSIIDLSIKGHQPMTYDDLVIVYNGEIYNYIEIKQKLLELGHQFETNTDTEVILHAYKEWGAACLNMFTGMWAFIILNIKSGQLFIARDIFGIKPIYFNVNDKFICFASEIKAILSLGVEPKANQRMLMDYLVAGVSDHTDQTFFSNVQQLVPGHYMLIDIQDYSFKIQRYFNVSLVKDAKNKFEKALRDSINLHLRSDVPVGTCLSGGLDSSTVCSIASGIYKSQSGMDFSAVTADSESPHNNELNYAKKVVDSCNLKWHIASPKYLDFKENVEKCLYIQEEPVGSASVFMQYWVMKEAKKAGLKVMLDGQGGDELLLGYERYYVAYFLFLIKKLKFFSLVKECFLATKNSKLSFFKLIMYFLYFSFPFLRLSRLKNRLKFIKKEYLSLTDETIMSLSKGFYDIVNFQTNEIFRYNLPHLLKYEDRNSMAHSIEARVPFLEKDVLSLSLSMLPEEKIKNGYTKFALRTIADKILPKQIVWRKNKFGFEAPSSLWQKQHKDIMQSYLSDSLMLKKICGSIPSVMDLDENIAWRLYNIAVWEKQYNVNI